MPIGAAALFLAQRQTYTIDRSLRFNDDDVAYLSRTPGSVGNNKTWTWSGWVKRGNLGITAYLFSAGTASTDYTAIYFDSSDKLNVIRVIASATDAQKVTTQLFRDPAAWYHIVVTMDAANTALTVYVNGSAVSALDTDNSPSNINDQVNASVLHEIGRRSYTPAGTYFDGYLAEVHLIDGQALTPSSFGETNTNGTWVPKRVTASHGTDGFWLSFANNASTTTLGQDDAGGVAGSGAGAVDWTLSNFSVTAGVGNDSRTDTPTNNYPTLNSLNAHSVLTLSQGDLQVTYAAGAYQAMVGATQAMLTGKWKWSVKVTVAGATGIGIFRANGQILGTEGTNNSFNSADSYMYFSPDGKKYNSSATGVAYGATYTTGDIIDVEFNADTGTLVFFKNGASQGTAYSGLANGPFFPAATVYSGGNVYFNFGTEAFTYTPSTGYVALCTANLTVPAVLKPSRYFNSVIYTGTGASLGVTGAGHQPDLVWIKGRSGATDHALYDSVRGVEKRLETNTDDEVTGDTTGLTAFGSDGFTLGALAQVNTNVATYVGWCWKESNIIAGLDIVTFTGNGANRTINHSLIAVPHFMIVKARTTAGANTNWAVYHRSNTSAPETDYLLLNSTAATADLNTYWNDTAPTSSVFSLGTHADVNTNNDTYLAYLWTEVTGFSKFGTFVGNASAAGQFVWCGFRPRFVLIKCTSTTGSWWLLDTARSTYNVASARVIAQAGDAESTSASIDFLSNGFKLRTVTADPNAAQTYVFAAWAEAPFNSALAR